MNNKEKLSCKIQTRITQSQKEQLDNLDVNLRDIVDYYIIHNTNPILQLKNRQKELLKNIETWENNIIDAKEELKEVNNKLGISIDENTATIEVVTIAERLKDNCHLENSDKCDKVTLLNYINSKKGKSVLNRGMIEFNIKGDDKIQSFKEDILKYLRID